MAEYIDRASLINNLITFAPEHYTPLINDLILKEPAADVVERKKGKWIHFSRSDECSVCGYDTGKYEAPTWFCPKCGADMRGDA